MKTFVDEHSIVREIWGKADTVLFIFAGSAAEFALNKAVDWLYFTGRLPADPLGRLFSTVAYSQQIIFSDYDHAIAAIDRITTIHRGVEQARGQQIPDWAYRDVLFMLIDYSIRSFELLERKLTISEKADVFDVFLRVGERMQLPGLPASYLQWEIMRSQHLYRDLVKSDCTVDLFRQYKKHLGWLRYFILKQVQVMIAPERVRKLLHLSRFAILRPALWAYKFLRMIRMARPFKNLLLPEQYKAQIIALDTSA